MSLSVRDDETVASAFERLEVVAERLRTRGFEAHVCPNMEMAQFVAVGLMPLDAQTLTASSETLRRSGLAAVIDDSHGFNAMRPRLKELGVEGRRIYASTPEVIIGSVQAITETGQVVCASATGSQLAAYAYGAQRVIWIVGSQKIVADLDAAFERIEKHCLPLENERAKRTYGRESVIAKTLVIDVEPEPGRTTVILVDEPLGF
jgi:LUD domain